MSDDGSKLLVADGGKLRVPGGGSGGDIYLSSDYGVTWKDVSPLTSFQFWSCVAISGDGAHAIAGIAGGFLYTSHDGGLTFKVQANSGLNFWTSVAVSADGNKMFAATTGDIEGLSIGNGIFKSINGGSSWTVLANTLYNWYQVLVSSDGINLVASVREFPYLSDFGHAFVSRDGGASWADQGPTGQYIAATRDGNTFYAVNQTLGATTKVNANAGGYYTINII